MVLAVAAAVLVPPLAANEYWLQAILIPFLIYSLAAIGLNLLTGYAGQLSLGTGGFMAVGAYAAFKLTTAFPQVNILIVFVLAGARGGRRGSRLRHPQPAHQGVLSRRGHPGLSVLPHLALQQGPVVHQLRLVRHHHRTIRSVLGVMVTGPEAAPAARYLVALALVAVFALVAKNLVRGRVGRAWMAIRDRDIAAEIIGIRPLRTKLLAFAISSFYCGVAGAELVFLYLGSAETLAFDINISFLVLFMVIIGGLGSILGSFLGAAFIVLVPIFLTNAPHLIGVRLPVGLLKQIELMIFGALIILFLIVEPHGLARLWHLSKEKLRLWPFPY